MEYAFLRQEGIRHLERMSGGVWTDFNVHDPGVTILEALCYALSDLSYRASHPIPDLLAEGGSDPMASLYGPGEILSSHPVTVSDLRKLALGVEGVKNVWIEPVEDDGLRVFYHPEREELSLKAEPPASEPLRLRGLHKVWIETSDLAGIDGTAVRAAVTRLLHENRSLCEDYAEIRVLEPQMIQVQVQVEVGSVEDANEVLVEIFDRIAGQISPAIRRMSFEQMLESGKALEEIFDGPLPQGGFVEQAALDQAERRARINTSDLVHAILTIPGVRAVCDIAVAAGGEPERWSLKLAAPDRPPRIDWGGSKFLLERGGIAVGVDVQKALDAYRQRLKKSAAATASLENRPPAGRDRRVGNYYSIQHHLPACYGTGALGLPESAMPERKARARQLKAYLMFFDQLLANYFAQLAHVKDLFSFHCDGGRTYFSSMVDDPLLRLEEIRPGDQEAHRRRLDAIMEDPAGPRSSVRQNRFLNHLLARFAEQFADYSRALLEATAETGIPAEEKLTRDKRTFLRRYPRISSARGTGLNYLAPEGDSHSGLEERVRLKLGLAEQLGEEFVLVEHILLRPMEGDEQQEVPLLAASSHKDPYSLQLSFVFPGEVDRLKRADVRSLIEHTIREETPAHLTPYVHWLDQEAFEKFRSAYREWIARRRDYWSEKATGGRRGASGA